MQSPTAPSPIKDFTPAGGFPSAAVPPSADATFAGLLARMAAPQNRGASWNDEELADDIANISYERALRNQAGSSAASSAAYSTLPKSDDGVVGASNRKAGSAATPKPLKNASITIRLSEPECVQLRLRAAEAGLTVSAYLRSCALEVESLRAQVKQTLAELRDSPPRFSEQPSMAQPSRTRPVLARAWQWFQRVTQRREPVKKLNSQIPAHSRP
jgi:hypothetical protein